MLKDHKDEMIVMLKRKNTELEEQLKQFGKQNDDLKKGDTQAEQKIKALSEMHASKIKTLLKSIQNLKKEVQKEKFEKKDNVRAQMIERLKKDIELQEIAINALRRLVNSEDKCDIAIKNELDKGPKRIRVASREELKMEINKYKNMTLRLLDVLKQNGIKQPAGFKVDMGAGTGLKEEKNQMFDINNMSANVSQKGDADENKEGDLGFNDQELLEAKERLEEQVVKQNMDMKDKNEKILELLEEIEDIKIQVYSRDKSIELQQKQIEDLLEELRDSKTVDNDIKILVSKKIALEEENQRLKKDMDEKFVQNHETQFSQDELAIENKSLIDQIKALQKQLEMERTDVKQSRAKIELERANLTKELTVSKKELEVARKEIAQIQKQNDDHQSKLSSIDGQTKGLIMNRDQEIDAYRKHVIELEQKVRETEGRAADYETKIVELSTEIADRDYEIEFYSNQIEDLKVELESAKSLAGNAGATTKSTQQAAGAGPTPAELDQWKKKCRMLQQREIELQEEIERINQLKQTEDRERTVNSLVDRQRSKSRGREQGQQ